MKFDPAMIAPMRDELTQAGAEQLLTAEKVESFLAEKSGTALVVINSVCGCAAGSARPGICQALTGPARPDKVGTVFAGQDVEATAALRGHFADYPPSSPAIALFKDGEVVHFVPRHAIEGREAGQVAAELTVAFEAHCSAPAS